ncbi:glycoside hydrolase 43 family protein [Sphingomonas arantia]|uniref:Glycoside hydrolase 43 family protein n=1 Tax=Sphingomonas arantia TaxID=1460676 RepID=A0ABW4U1U1_9SPHN
MAYGALALLMATTLLPAAATPSSAPRTWTADNGNGTFTNPLFFDEFSDPDMIRVGDDFYMTGTTMHTMPGLPILHSRDLVNWTFLGYALDKLDLGPEYRLEGGKHIYGRGIWAPSLRYRDGTFYIFSNVNGQNTQRFTATNPGGPWTRTPMKRSFHDLSVLFDDDGKAYVIWGYQDIHMAQLDASLTDIVPGTERIVIPKGAGMGEGSHFYKFDGRYYITSAEYAVRFRMPAARASSPFGPYEVNPEISADEEFGETAGWRVAGNKEPLTLRGPDPKARGGLAMHQGGVIQTPAGEWWGWSMFEGNSVGRLTALSPVTWKDGWPYFGLPGNLGRSPRTWVKPRLAASPDHAPYERSDSFTGPALGAIWQWNHVPVAANWSLAARPGALRLTTLPAPGFLQARNTLTQRAIGPQSTPVVELDVAGLRAGDVAGLALLNRPFATIGVERSAKGLELVMTDELAGTVRRPLTATHLWLRATADLAHDRAQFGVSTDGRAFTDFGTPVTMPFQLLTFQGVRYALFAYNGAGRPGGHADFLDFKVTEGQPESRPDIPYGRTISLTPIGRPAAPALAGLSVGQHPLGRVSLTRGGQSLTTASDGSVALRRTDGSPAQQYQWMESLSGGAVLMSLVTNRYLHVASDSTLRADSLGPSADNADGSRFRVQ